MAAQLHFNILAYDDVKCSKCLKFRKWDEGKGWHRWHCPECMRERQRRRYADNRDKESERKRRYYIDNRDAVLERCRRYREADPEAARERSRKSYAANPDRARRYRAANADAIRETKRRYQAANADAIRERMRKYRAANVDATRERNRKYYIANKAALLEHTRQYLAANPKVRRKQHRNRRARKHKAICEHGKGCFSVAAERMPQRCTYCGTNQDIVADHYRPLADGGLDCKDNLQPACRSCNSRKGAKDPVVFAQQELGRLF